MNPPNLHALQIGDSAAWDEAFQWLWPTVFAVAQLKLQPYFPNEVEDVAIEALEELVEKVRVIKSSEELKPLAASIAHHRAVSLLRERFAKKRGEGKTESLDAPTADGETKPEPASGDSPLAGRTATRLLVSCSSHDANCFLEQLIAPARKLLLPCRFSPKSAESLCGARLQ